MEYRKMTWQGDMFDKPQPVFLGIPEWLKKPALKIWNLYEKFGGRITDDDQYLIYEYWMTEGLGEALGSEEAIQGFYEWFMGVNVTPPETIRRTRQWLTSDEGYLPVSDHVYKARKHKQDMVRNQAKGKVLVK